MKKIFVERVLIGLAAFSLQSTAATQTVVLQNGLNGYTGIEDMFWGTSDGGNRGYPAEGQYVASTFPELWVDAGG